MANEVVPFWKPGDSITARASAAVTGKRFVTISGNPTGGNPTVAPAGAGVVVFGVAAMDAAANADVLLYGGPGTILPVTAGAALTAGQEVQADANGAAIPLAAGKRAGIVMGDAANAAEAIVKLT